MSLSCFRADFRRYYQSRSGNMFQKGMDCWRNPGLWAILFYRYGNWVSRQRKPLRIFLLPVFYALFHWSRSRWGIEIYPTVQIGPGFVINHYGGVFIGPKSLVVGRNFSIHHDVTIGFGAEEKRGGATIGDNVTIAPGAKILGPVRIGNNVKIGPNAVVQRNLPDNSIASVGPPRIITFPSPSQGEP